MRWTRIGVAAFIAALAIALALSLGLWGSWTAGADPAVLWVDAAPDPATEPADCTTAPYNTIAGALAVAADDDIIRLCEGTYPGATTIDEKVTVEGRAEASRADVKIEETTAGKNGLAVSVDGVTIRHLTLDGPAGTGNGILLNSGADDTTISDVEATDWEDGIHVSQSTGTVVEKSNVHDNAFDGVELVDGEENVVRDNEIKDNGDDGIDVDGEDDALLEGNTLSGNTNSQIDVVHNSHVHIHRNQIDSSSDGISVGPVPAEALIEIGGSPENANTFTGPFGGANYYIELDCDAENTVDATYNWWGSTNPVDIANRIFNDEDDPTAAVPDCPAPDNLKGAVVFHPWASGPAPTPTPSPTPTTTVTPTPTVTVTPTPTGTPGATRSIDLSPAGWHDLAWSGADATDPGTALACISGKYNIAYAWEGPAAGFKRYVQGCAIPGICNMGALDKYDTMLVLITASGVTCQMPVAQ